MCPECCLKVIGISLKIKEDWSTRITALKQRFEILSDHEARQQKALKLRALKIEIASRKAQVDKSMRLLRELREAVDRAKDFAFRPVPQVADSKDPLSPSDPTGQLSPKDNTNYIEQECERLRDLHLREAADVLSQNSFFPAFSVSELFTINETESMFRLGESTTIGQSRINETIVLVRMRTDLSLANEAHKHSVAGSVEMLCRFINFTSHLLHVDLPFDLIWINQKFSLLDSMRNIQPLDVLNLYSLETSMLLLYLDFRVLLLSRNINPAASSLFDVQTLLRGYETKLAMKTDFLPQTFELGINCYNSESEGEQSSDDSWEML